MCIYCGIEFNPSRGKGDHVLPAALGEFQDDVRFRGQCTRCNNLNGRSEQQVVQSGPEGFYRDIIRPASGRLAKRGIGRQQGALGAPRPVYTATMGDHTVLVEPSAEDPRDASAVDQIVIRDDQGEDHPLRLYERMSAGQLQKRIKNLGVGKIKEVRLDCDQPHAESYLRLVQNVFPDLKHKEESTTEAGRMQLRGRVKFSVKLPYYQALAKIAFHYYLSRSRRGYRGDESMFDELRDFIVNGGDVGRFFRYAEGRFRLPFGEVASGVVITPSDWCHVMAADETAGCVVVYLHLFVGPGCVRTPCYVTLGKLPSHLVVPDSVWGHAYVYDSQFANSRYCGRVVRVSISRLR